MVEERFGIRDSHGCEIPMEELDPRTKETTEVLSLLRNNPIVVLTTDSPGFGKSTFARILRHKILTQEPRDEDFPDCVYTRIEEIQLGDVEPKRQDRFNTMDRFSYADLRRFRGLIIFDECYPEYLPLALTFNRSKLLLIIQPDFLQGPPFDDEEHQQLAQWVRGSQIPVYKLGMHGSREKPTE